MTKLSAKEYDRQVLESVIGPFVLHPKYYGGRKSTALRASDINPGKPRRVYAKKARNNMVDVEGFKFVVEPETPPASPASEDLRTESKHRYNCSTCKRYDKLRYEPEERGWVCSDCGNNGFYSINEAESEEDKTKSAKCPDAPRKENPTFTITSPGNKAARKLNFEETDEEVDFVSNLLARIKTLEESCGYTYNNGYFCCLECGKLTCECICCRGCGTVLEHCFCPKSPIFD